MAVVPALATMAALTLLQNPAAQPEDVSVDYSPFSDLARRLQRGVRNLLRRRRGTRYRRQLVWEVGYQRWVREVYGSGRVQYYGPGFGVVNSLWRPFGSSAIPRHNWEAMERTI